MRSWDWRSALLIYLIVMAAWLATDAAMGRHAEFFNSYELVLQIAGSGHPGRPFVVGQAELGAWAWILGVAALLLLPALVVVVGLGAIRLHEGKRARGGWRHSRRDDAAGSRLRQRPRAPGHENARRDDDGPS